MEGWTKPGELWPLVVCNLSDAAVRPSPELKLLAPDELDVHPGTGLTPGAFAVVRWTAPSTGNYLISAMWRDIDLNCALVLALTLCETGFRSLTRMFLTEGVHPLFVISLPCLLAI